MEPMETEVASTSTSGKVTASNNIDNPRVRQSVCSCSY